MRLKEAQRAGSLQDRLHARRGSREHKVAAMASHGLLGREQHLQAGAVQRLRLGEIKLQRGSGRQHRQQAITQGRRIAVDKVTSNLDALATACYTNLGRRTSHNAHFIKILNFSKDINHREGA